MPCPIVYGAVVDSACLFWETRCGEAGACRLYDAQRFRLAFHGLTALIMAAAFLVDLCVCSLAAGVRFDDDTLPCPGHETRLVPADATLKSESSV